MMRRVIGLASVMAIMSVVIAACGGSDATATPQPTATRVPPTATTAPATATTAAQPTATGARPTGVPATATGVQATRVAPTATPAPTATRPPAPTVAATPTGPQPRYGGTLQARFYREFTIWDTYHAAGGFTTLFLQNDLSNLVRFRRDSISVMEPDTAASWELGSDGKTYTFKLRQDVVWHDGKPFTSADVLYNFKRASDPKYTFNAGRVAPIATMEAPDPYTFKLTLKAYSNSFLPNMAGPFMLMYPAHITDMAAWQKSPVGSGPFVFKSYVGAQTIEFTKNAKYYQKDTAGRALPYLDGLTYSIIPDSGLALAAFRSGRVQCGCSSDNDWVFAAVPTLRKDIPGVKLNQYLAPRMNIMFNMRRAPFNNTAFRLAVAIGLNKEEAAAAVFNGTSLRPTPPLIPPEAGGLWGLPKGELTKLPGFNPDHSKDTAIALQKFKESGIDPKSQSLELLQGGTTFATVGEAMASVLTSEYGIKIKSTLASSVAENVQRRKDGNYDFYVLTQGDALDDPADQYNIYMLSNAAENYSGYANPRLDQLIAQQDSEIDPVKRRALLWEVQRMHLTDFPTVSVMLTQGFRGVRPEVFGYIVGPVVTHAANRLEGLWLAP